MYNCKTKSMEIISKLQTWNTVKHWHTLGANLKWLSSLTVLVKILLLWSLSCVCIVYSRIIFTWNSNWFCCCFEALFVLNAVMLSMFNYITASSTSSTSSLTLRSESDWTGKGSICPGEATVTKVLLEDCSDEQSGYCAVCERV